MADLTVTVANVKPNGNTLMANFIAGASLLQGEVVYQEADGLDIKLADNDSATAEVRGIKGLALTNSLLGQPVVVALPGSEVILGAILTAGVEYYLSGTPGKIAPRADVTTGDEVVRIGIALTNSVLKLDTFDSGVTL